MVEVRQSYPYPRRMICFGYRGYYIKFHGATIFLAFVSFIFGIYLDHTLNNVTPTDMDPVVPKPDIITEFEKRQVKGLGDNGLGLSKIPDEKEANDYLHSYWACNKNASDQIDVRRKLPDFSHPDCKSVTYDTSVFSKILVIIVVKDEIFSTLVRAIWSLLLHDNGAEHIKQIMIVDDNSKDPDIVSLLPEYINHYWSNHYGGQGIARFHDIKVKLLRLKTEHGFGSAIMAGFLNANKREVDSVLVFNSRAEATGGWLKPLMNHIANNYQSIAVPIVDRIDSYNFEYVDRAVSRDVRVGGFSWTGQTVYTNNQQSYQVREDRMAYDPVPTPTIPHSDGPVFLADKNFFEAIGGFDGDMAGFGGEMLDLSIRAWRCGGSVEIVPCSHVGHVRSNLHRVYDDRRDRNLARTAYIWMDKYKELFYLHHPQYNVSDIQKSSNLNEDKVGDHKVMVDLIGQTRRQRDSRDRLLCRSFDWYMNNVYHKKFIQNDPDSVEHVGQFKNVKSGQCLSGDVEKLFEDDRVGVNDERDFTGHEPLVKPSRFSLQQSECLTPKLGSVYMSQVWSYVKDHRLRNEFHCLRERLTAKTFKRDVEIYPCLDTKYDGRWELIDVFATDDKKKKIGVMIKFASGNVCMTSEGGFVSLNRCSETKDLTQVWDIIHL